MIYKLKDQIQSFSEFSDTGIPCKSEKTQLESEFIEQIRVF